MKLRLEREAITAQATHGVLYIGDLRLCATLENPSSAEKGAIPAGVYEVALRYSPRFQMLLPELQRIPGFTDILIHSGNTEKDTTGCILVGNYRVDDATVAESRLALGRLLTRWRDWNDDVITITEVHP